MLSLTGLKLEDLPLATAKELAMARGSGRSDRGGILAGLSSLGGGGGGGFSGSTESAGDEGPRRHRSLEEAFVKEGAGGTLKFKGFVEEDFGLVFDEVGSGRSQN